MVSQTTSILDAIHLGATICILCVDEQPAALVESPDGGHGGYRLHLVLDHSSLQSEVRAARSSRLCLADWVVDRRHSREWLLSSIRRDCIHGYADWNITSRAGESLILRDALRGLLNCSLQDGLSAAGGLSSNYNKAGQDEYTQSLTLARKSTSKVKLQSIVC